MYTNEQRQRNADRLRRIEEATKKLEAASAKLTEAAKAYGLAKSELERLHDAHRIGPC